MKIINVDNIYAWAILVSSISQVIITGWTFSQCFKIRISKVLFTALIILVSCIAIVPPTFFRFISDKSGGFVYSCVCCVQAVV